MSSSSAHEQFAHLNIPHQEIASATNNFSDANLIKGSELGKAYKGQLLRSEQMINIVAQRFDHEHKDRDTEFWNEISMLSTLKHKNLVSMVGFCDESGKIIIYKHEANKGSLDTFLKNPTLTWMRRLQICVGVARALSHIHYDDARDFSVIHCDIRSSKVLLDDNWEAKLSGFELSLKQRADQKNGLVFTDVCGTYGYRDPTYNQSGSVTHKADMYSFGVVLFEVLCGKKAVMVDENNRLLAPLVISEYEGGRLDNMIDPGLRRQMDPESLQIFSELAYNCLKDQRSQRPNIGVVVMELEKAVESQWKHDSPLILKAAAEGASSKNLQEGDLKHLEIQLSDIQIATGDFKRDVIGSGTFGEVYKAELEHFDGKSFFPLEEKNMNDRPKKRSTVAIKRIKIREDQRGEEGFLAEIEMLTNCKHRNIVSLLGFCKEDSHMILVYEHATNGSLLSYMGSTGKYLTWVQRIKISIEIARGLNYLHTKIEDKRRIIHRDIKSDNILLGEDFVAKIADFGLSKFRPENQQVNTILTNTYAGTDYYMDPEYSVEGKLSNKIDIYSLGVVLFEMLSGRLANDIIYINEDSNGIAPVAHRRFNDSTIKEMVDPRLWEETHENSTSSLTKGPNEYSLHAFIEIAHQCVAKEQTDRPTADDIAKKLEEALSFQEGNLKHLEIPFIDILSATENFAKSYLIGSGVYKAELEHFDSKKFLSFEKKTKSELPKKRSTVAIKRISIREDKVGEHGFRDEIEMLASCKHPNILSLLGFCEEGTLMILVFEHPTNGSLDKYNLRNTGNLNNLTWVQRIKICIHIAQGMNFIHNKIEDEQRMIHLDIRSSNILLGEKWEAKIAGFELSKFHSDDNQQLINALYNKSELKNGINIYSFGVVLFEILAGRFANDPLYMEENSKGIVPIACRHVNEGTIRKMVDPRLMEETHRNVLTLGPGEDSLHTFSKIAYQCVVEHPTTKVIVNKLQEALYSQENIKDHFKFSLEYILSATQHFSENNLISASFSHVLYKGEVTNIRGDGCKTIAVKRLNGRDPDKKDNGFLKELQTLFEYKHENIIGIVGYCTEMGEKIIVYEYAHRGSLDKYLKDKGLTWMKRLKICIDIASGLGFLHGGGVRQEVLIHRDMRTSKILLNDDWKAKLSEFEHSLTRTLDKEIDCFLITKASGTQGYMDPEYMETGHLKKRSDIYSFGVVLSEILSGKLVFEYQNEQQRNLKRFLKRCYAEGKADEMVFEGIKKQIAPKSLTTFITISCQCLHHSPEKRPTAQKVIRELKQALESQEDYEMWEPKLPKDYEKLIHMSNSQENSYKDLYDMFCKGILLEEDTVFFSLRGNGENNEMISARNFSYKNRRSYKWRSVPESRFPKVAKMFDNSDLNIQVKIKPQFLSPGVHYGVHLVFRFSKSIKSIAKRRYVNLNYKLGNESLHAYFATRREDGWMMVELCQFLNHVKDAEFEFLLESFSKCHSGSRGVYVQGIEFRAIDNVKHEENEKSKEVQQVQESKFNMDQVQPSPTNFEKLLWRFENKGKSQENKMNKKKSYMLSAKEALYGSYDVKLLNSEPSPQSKSQEVIELQRQQVFRIKCKIEGERLSPDTEYACYLVFKLSKNCRGLHYPVIVRNLLQRKNKAKGIIYFRSPSTCNVNDTDQVPEEREDGWMEVRVWQFNSMNDLRDDCVSINLKLISYGGTMSGLIISSLEFLPCVE